MSAAALKNDFIGLFCDCIIEQTGYRLDEVLRRFLHKKIRNPGVDQGTAALIGKGKKFLQRVVDCSVVAGGTQQRDEAVDLSDRSAPSIGSRDHVPFSSTDEPT